MTHGAGKIALGVAAISKTRCKDQALLLPFSLEFERQFGEIRSGSGIEDHKKSSWHYEVACIRQFWRQPDAFWVIAKHHCICTVTCQERLVEAVLGWGKQKLSTVLTLPFVRFRGQ